MNVPPQALHAPHLQPGDSSEDFLRLLPGYEHRTADMDFARPVAKNGYLWWYVDAISDDGDQAFTMIVFVGSVFSPYYARARRDQLQDAEQHCAFNTILYGPRGKKRWSMTERSARSLQRSRDSYRLGPSAMHWDGRQLTAEISEWCVPMPRKMSGRVTVTPSALTRHTVLLDDPGRHRWHPLAPIARVEVDFPGMGVRWSGDGYLDCNEGNEPLADGFVGWDWARLRMNDDECTVRYETRPHMSQPRRLSLSFDSTGGMQAIKPSDSRALQTTGVWRIPRQVPSSSGYDDRLERTLEDTPFYARSLLRTASDGQHGQGFHESLCMNRFEQPWVQTLLPFRMPRIR